MSVFTRARAFTPSKSLFNLSYTKKFDCDAGELIPVYLTECLPGDRFSIGNSVVIRMQPLVAPIVHNLFVRTEYFFCPSRILWEDFEHFFKGVKDPTESEDDVPSMSKWDDYTYDGSTTPTTPPMYSLWDYFGLPLVSPSSLDVTPLDLPRTMYNMIFNEFYRDENVDNEVALDSNDVQLRRWKKDYFTSALPFQQRGISPSFPLSGSASAIWDKNIPIKSWYSSKQSLSENVSLVNDLFGSGVSGTDTDRFLSNDYSGTSNGAMYQSSLPSNSTNNLHFPGVPKDGGNYLRFGTSAPYTYPQKHIGLNDNKVDLSSVGTFNIQDLRLSLAIQHFLEKSAVGGYRYDEFLLAHFGIAPKDETLQHPVYLGGSKSPILISDVLQTSESSEDGTPQGNLAGRGINASTARISKWICSEPGYIMGLMSICPDLGYTSQGINKMWLHENRFDYPLPDFTHLGEQPIKNCELYLDAYSNTGADDWNKATFGYQGVFDEYRHRQDETSGLLRNTTNGLAYWHLNNIFTSRPALNPDFLKMSVRKDVFYYTDQKGFVVDFRNNVVAVRPLPKFPTPGLRSF